jgi:hypothetical protein
MVEQQGPVVLDQERERLPHRLFVPADRLAELERDGAGVQLAHLAAEGVAEPRTSRPAYRPPTS